MFAPLAGQSVHLSYDLRLDALRPNYFFLNFP